MLFFYVYTEGPFRVTLTLFMSYLLSSATRISTAPHGKGHEWFHWPNQPEWAVPKIHPCPITE